LVNRSLPLGKLAALLADGGFSTVVFSRIDRLPNPLADPEGEKRVIVLARR
jgi:hypothetical protein